MVSTHLENISQIGTFPQVWVKKKIGNHHLDYSLALAPHRRCKKMITSAPGFQPLQLHKNTTGILGFQPTVWTQHPDVGYFLEDSHLYLAISIHFKSMEVQHLRFQTTQWSDQHPKKKNTQIPHLQYHFGIAIRRTPNPELITWSMLINSDASHQASLQRRVKLTPSSK